MKHAQYLFVYGTLRRNRQNQIQHPLLDDCDYLSNGFMHGELYEIDAYPGAVAGGTELVKGELYLMQNPEQTLSVLDIYEECASSFPPPHEYRREQVIVTLADKSRIQAWIYIYQHSTNGLQRINNGDYSSFLPSRHRQV